MRIEEVKEKLEAAAVNSLKSFYGAIANEDTIKEITKAANKAVTEAFDKIPEEDIKRMNLDIPTISVEINKGHVLVRMYGLESFDNGHGWN